MNDGTMDKEKWREGGEVKEAGDEGRRERERENVGGVGLKQDKRAK